MRKSKKKGKRLKFVAFFQRFNGVRDTSRLLKAFSMHPEARTPLLFSFSSKLETSKELYSAPLTAGERGGQLCIFKVVY